MPAIQLTPATSVRLGLRGLQFLSSLIALATIAAGFRSVSSFGLSSMLGSHSSNFSLLLTYTSMLYALYEILAVEVFRTVPRTQRLTALAVDGAFALVLFIGAIVLATSDYVSDCDSYGYALRCGNLTAGTVFMFIACAAFICTAVLTFLGKLSPAGPASSADAEAGESIPYVEETTPKALSPMGVSPSNKV